MSNKSKLLLDSNPLIVIPELAVLIGLNESILLQQIHYWIQKSTHFYDGRAWVYNTIPQWLEQFPFWSEATLKRTFTSLKEHDLIMTGNYNRYKFDRTMWYAINYDVLEALQEKALKPHKKPSGQNDLMVRSELELNDTPTYEKDEKKPPKPHKKPSGQNDLMMRSKRPDGEVNLTRPIPETTPEITSETSSCSFNPKEDLNYKEHYTHTHSEVTSTAPRQNKKQNRVCATSTIDMEALQKEIGEVIGETFGFYQLHRLVRLKDVTVERIRYHLAHWSIHVKNKTSSAGGYFFCVVANNIEPKEPEQRKQQYYNNNQKPQRDNFEQREYTDEEFEGFYAKLVK